MKKNAFIRGALILIIFNLLGKVIGAIYRIPLAKIVGSVGMGQYQLTFPLYCLILTISTSGIPVAISKLVAEFNENKRFCDTRKLLKVSILFLTLLSIIGAVVVVFGAKIIASLQGNPDAYVCYYGIAPAIVFVGVLSAFRGYFQGNLKMFPTAFSGLLEQVIKLVVGLFLAEKFLVFGVEYAVFGALLGVSISEVVALLFLVISYFVYSRKQKINFDGETLTYKVLSKKLASLALPITLGGLVSPITTMVDSLLVINLLMFTGFSNEMSTMMLGIQSGVVEPLVNIPVIIAVSVATALLPSLSGLSASGDRDQVKKHIEKAFQICLSISIACFVCFVIFGKQILTFLYGSSFDFEELELAVKLLFLGGLNIIFLSLVQVSAGVLQGIGKPKEPVKSLLVGCVIKIALDVCLILIKPLNIMGAVVSGGVCYFVVLVLNYKKIKEFAGAKMFNEYNYISIQACFVCLFAFFSNMLFKMIVSDIAAMFIAGGVAVAVYGITFYVFFMQDADVSETFEMNNLTW